MVSKPIFKSCIKQIGFQQLNLFRTVKFTGVWICIIVMRIRVPGVNEDIKVECSKKGTKILSSYFHKTKTNQNVHEICISRPGKDMQIHADPDQKH